MAEHFEDISVVRFNAGLLDQDSEHQSLFRFHFVLSGLAPDLWVQIAGQEVGNGEGLNPYLKRSAWAYRDSIVVCCIADEAQEIKDVLNTQVLPRINQRYRSDAATAHQQERTEDDQQHAILIDVKRAIRDQM